MVNLLHGATGLFDKKRKPIQQRFLCNQEQIIAAAGVNAGAHSMHNCRSGVTVFLTCHGGIQNLSHFFYWRIVAAVARAKARQQKRWRRPRYEMNKKNS